MSFPDSPYCRVRARVASIWADGPDDGTHPDWKPAAGEKVDLTPSIGSQLLTYDVAGPEPIIVTVERVECVVDEDGWLTKSDGRPVFIAPTDDPRLSATGWTWTANIKGKSVVFAAPTGGVVDLAMFIAAPATGNTQMWIERIPELIDAAGNLVGIDTVSEDAGDIVVTLTDGTVFRFPLPEGAPGREVELRTTATHVQWRYTGDATWTDLIPLTLISGTDGDPGREVELQTSATHVQWRYVGDATWLDLIPLSVISGDDGLSAELQTTATHIQWRQAGGAWADLVALEALKGDPGPANSLDIGTVTSGPAAASLTGTAPNQVLNLVLQPGAPGPPGSPGAVPTAADYLVVGTGRPDVPATTPYTAGQLTDLPIGCEYRSTDGAGTGAHAWRKIVGGTWVVTQGDTGWRDIKEAYISAVSPQSLSGMAVRRQNAMVHLYFDRLRFATSGMKPFPLRSIAPGFNPLEAWSTYYNTASWPLINDAGTAFLGKVTYWDAQPELKIAPAGAGVSLSSGWTIATSSAWPTTLPGTAF